MASSPKKSVAVAKAVPVAAEKPAAGPPKFCLSMYPGRKTAIPGELSDLIRGAEKITKTKVIAFIQNGDASGWGDISFQVFKSFQREMRDLKQDEPISLLIESPGGDAHFAYRISRMIQRRTKNFTVMIPQYAKSAATLMSLGASRLIIGRDAELGPLDVQIFDREREDFGSALDAVQALERLNAFSLSAVDQSMMLINRRVQKKTDTILPMILKYASDFVRPLLEKIDTVDYIRKSRDLKVAEEYAFRLLRARKLPESRKIARQLVENYPTHGFVIDQDEVSSSADQSNGYGLGLPIEQPSDALQTIFHELIPFLDRGTFFGHLIPLKP